MSELITAGSTDQTIDIFLQDSSSSTGGGLTGLTYSSGGLTCYYRKGATGSATQLTLAAQTVGGSHTDGGFVEIDSTNAPGLYRLDLSDTMVAVEGFVSVYLHGATNLLQTVLRINCQTLAADVVKVSGDSTAADNLELDYDGTGYNKSNSTIGTTTTNTDMRGTDSAFLASSAPSNFSLLGINGSGHVSQVTLVDTTTVNSDMVDVSALATESSIASLNNFDPLSQTVTTDSASRIASQADVSALATAANLAIVDTVVDDIKVTTDKLDDTFEIDGSEYRFTANALEEAPSGGGGSAPTEAEIYTYFTASSREDAFKADVSALATTSALTTVDTVVDGIKAVTDNLPDSGALSSLATASSVSTVDTVVDAIKVTTDKLDDTLELDGSDYRFTTNALEQAPTGGGSAPTEAEIYTYFTASSREDLFKADVSSLATAASLTTVDTVVDGIKAVTDNLPNSGALTDLATAAALTTVDTVVDAIKVTTDKLDDTFELDGSDYRFTANALEEAPTGGGGSAPTEAEIYTYFTASSRQDVFKADVSALATSASISALNDFDPATETVTTDSASRTASQADVSALATAASISALNDLSSADVTAAVPTAAQIRTEIDSNSTQIALLVDGQGYQLTILAGSISNAGTAVEAYTFSYNSTDYAATYAGLDASGNRGTTVLSKP